MITPHHPAFRCTARAVVNTFKQRFEVEKVNREIARLLLIRDEMFHSEFHVGRVANGVFRLPPHARTKMTEDIVSLRRRKMMLLDYIKRTEKLNEEIRQGTQTADPQKQYSPPAPAAPASASTA
eukprot:Hpha_TRINITY_DN6915_c0_g1::TRINITY_DN6915_c0_g1_i1::g.139489::m.139489